MSANAVFIYLKGKIIGLQNMWDRLASHWNSANLSCPIPMISNSKPIRFLSTRAADPETPEHTLGYNPEWFLLSYKEKIRMRLGFFLLLNRRGDLDLIK